MQAPQRATGAIGQEITVAWLDTFPEKAKTASRVWMQAEFLEVKSWVLNRLTRGSEMIGRGLPAIDWREDWIAFGVRDKQGKELSLCMVPKKSTAADAVMKLKKGDHLRLSGTLKSFAYMGENDPWFQVSEVEILK
jgi:hypothetical protein